MSAHPASGVYALLADGSTVEIRPAAAGDFGAVQDMHRAMSPDNIYLRFFSVSPAAAGREARRICREPAAGSRRPAGLAGGRAGGRGQLRDQRRRRPGRDRVRRRRPCPPPRGGHAAARAPGVGRPESRRADLHRRRPGGELRDAEGVRRCWPAGQAHDGRRRDRAGLRPARRRRRPGLGGLPGRGGRAGGPGGRGEPAARARRGVGSRGGGQPEARVGRPGHPA